MVTLKSKPDIHDLFRLASYSQLEGSFREYQGSYRFTFYTQQISDMKDLIQRVVDVPLQDISDRTYIQFYSKELYKSIKDLGFFKFGTHDWNIPRAYHQSKDLKKEYLRAIVDSLGTVDIDKTVPYIRAHSVNERGMEAINEIYGGKLYTSRGISYLQWKGKDALQTGGYLGWRFYCHRNIRGAELIKDINWANFVW